MTQAPPTESRLLLLTHNFPRWEGDFAGVFLVPLVEEIAGSGVGVTVVSPHSAGAKRSEVRNRIEIRRFRYSPVKFETLAYSGDMHEQAAKPSGFLKLGFFMIAFVWKALFASIRAGKPQIFAQWLFPAGVVGWVVSILRRLPLYVTCHGTDIALLGKSRLLRAVARLVLRRATTTVTVSSYLREKLIESTSVKPDKIAVCPMPAHTDLFGTMQTPLRTPPLVLAVARFTKQKQLDVLLKSLSIVKGKQVRFVCEIYGEGTLQADLLKLIDSLNLTDSIMLCSPVSQRELASIYPTATVTVLPSVQEGFGMTLVEAQLSGCAVIGAASGGITDIIEDGKTGLLFTPGDAEELAELLLKVIKNGDLRAGLAQRGKQEAARRFSPAAIASTYLELIGIRRRD